jgi:hypothetical protein
VAAEPTSHEPSIGERVDYARAQLPASQRQPYTDELRKATEQALATGDYSPLGDVVKRWYRAARLVARQL